MVQQLKRTARGLIRSPFYLVASVLVLGLSIGAQLAVVSIVDGILLRPPSGKAPEQLAFVTSSYPSGIVGYGDFIDFKERNTFFSSTFAFTRSNPVGLAVGEQLAMVDSVAVSSDFFRTLGIDPQSGRLFQESDDVQGAQPVAVVSDELSRQMTLGTGSSIQINHKPFLVVGVLPPHFRGIDRDVRPDIWFPLWASLTADGTTWFTKDRGVDWLRIGGRLKENRSFASAAAETAVIGRRLQVEYPKTNGGIDFGLDSYAKFRLSQEHSSTLLLIILGVVWLLFALAFSNFFTLTLLRLFSRRRELAVKMALGAQLRDLAKDVCCELAAVLTLALTLGYAVSWWLLGALRLIPDLGARIEAAHAKVDGRTIAVVLALALLSIATVLFLIVRNARRIDLVDAFKETASAPNRQRMFIALFAGQFALAFALLSIGLTFVATLHTVASRSLPIRTDRVLFMDVNFRLLGDKARPAEISTPAILARLREIPGVTAAAASGTAPFAYSSWTNLIFDGKDPALESDRNLASVVSISPGFYDASGLPIVKGRAIDEHDIAANAPVALVSRLAVHRFWPQVDPIGKTFRPWPSAPPYTVIGICDDMPVMSTSSPRPQIFMPFTQWFRSRLTFYIAVQDDSPAWNDRITKALGGIWPYRTPPPIRSIKVQIQNSLLELATAVRVISWIVAFAGIITGIGMYLLSAYTTLQGLKDTAIRRALGASRMNVVWVHVRRYRLGILLGLFMGSALAFGAGPVLQAANIPIRPTDGLLLSISAASMLILALAGLCIPILRAGSMSIFGVIKRND